jgi:hypothetical protein
MVMQRAMSSIRSAYREIADTAMGIKSDNSSKAGKTDGTVPAYLTNQISNYQAALNRLTAAANGQPFSGPVVLESVIDAS